MTNKEQYYEFLDASITIIDSVRQLRDYGSWTEEKFALMLALDQTTRDFGSSTPINLQESVLKIAKM